MKLYRITLFSLLLCLIFPLTTIAGPLEDANTAIKNEDYKKAGELLLPLAEENNAEAQTLLGAMYVNGQGVEKDFNKGMALIMKAATQGFKPARIQAFKLCLDLANQGDTGAMYNVGYMCLNGWGGGEYENDICLKWIENAGKLGHEKSSKILAGIYEKGKYGVTPDAEKAAYWNNLAKAFAAGVDGKWKGSIPGMGGKPMDISYEFKTEGDKLTGTTVGFGGKENEIKEGKVDGNNLTFTVESRFQGMKSTANYTGVFLGDTLKLTFTSNMGRGKASPPTTFDAKRAE
ncbi:MAG: sel1 repeat family protein [Deltaproteobacteria bacterium]|nr:sel1 repeat family protein [Deltaproteobacteria bacterium]